ncbi:MAG: prolipoprotein diacylglyceryl transferase [Clostridia bacterium]|nr:prolipoprotein diacylglyceryl transferase [Clostridia bacterium]
MSLKRLGIIAIGMLAMMVLMTLRRKKYPDVSLWKAIVLGFLLTVAGVAGTMLMFFIENGRFGGTSFFGAILFVPILIAPALLLKLRYKTILDLCAPSEALMLAIMKLDCLANGCCVGKYLPTLHFQFPSQIVEMCASLLVMFVLLALEKREKDTHLYAWYLLLYGSTRFVLNWFRYGTKPWIWILPNSIVWSILSVLIGIIWLAVSARKRPQEIPAES